MPSIIIIDGGESGTRVERIEKKIRYNITKKELDIKISKSRKDHNGEYINIQGFNLAFVHSSDNMDDYSKPIFTLNAQKYSIPLVLYSGGFKNFKIIKNNICEINDSLLEKRIINFLKYLVQNNFSDIDFKYLYPGKEFLNLEKLFILRKNIILNFENSSIFTLNEYYSEFINILNSIQREVKYNSIESYLKDDNTIDINNLLSYINKSILKFEKSITKEEAINE